MTIDGHNGADELKREPEPKPRTTPDAGADETIIRLKRELEENVTSLTETNRQLKRKIFDLYTIFEISRNFSAVLDYHALLDTFILTSLAQVGASKAAMFLRENGQSDRFTLVSKRGAGRFPAEDEFFPAESRLITYLTKLNRPVKTEEVIDEVADVAEGRVLGYFHPGLVVPLVHKATLRGIFTICEKISRWDFQMDDIEFLSILGNQISVAIDNARLYQAERTATQQLRAAQQQLVQAERLAALGEMSAKVAHEVNNPLGIIKNYLLLLRRVAGDAPQTSQYSDVISQEIDRIARIIRQLLDFHRPDRIPYQRSDVTDVMNQVILLMKPQLDRFGIEVIRDYKPQLPRVLASPEGLKQVFMNLIINACDACQNVGGRLRIEIGPEEGLLVIRVSDTGPGIETEHIPHIFEPFFTTKDPGHGTGLGLSVCYGIIKRHQGSITYRNTAEGGQFKISLPVGDGSGERAS